MDAVAVVDVVAGAVDVDADDAGALAGVAGDCAGGADVAGGLAIGLLGSGCLPGCGDMRRRKGQRRQRRRTTT